ncbi:hypothetical protein GLW08_02350 [Pontibacillus yanchengensis]|uniref:Uncharacterized protein n=2 Tax=Pontibacillus yanchengensis TaxID=462910 RepID=A0ACC7VBX1_9BACI|nr:hypothetical protein [Pontibacillus yanchengensis]MYL32975.1 hypothetical protein [Pontibacillus yanchengensis]MYL52175.1 hypothetical protein [Pontibacillus yanchengensis]
MLKGWLPVVFIFVLITGSCSPKEASTLNVYQMTPDDYKVFFYSEQSKLELEENYIDALLKLRLSNPEKLGNLSLSKSSIFSTETNHPSIKHYPALVIEKNGQTLATMSGQKRKNDIFTLLQDTITYE